MESTRDVLAFHLPTGPKILRFLQGGIEPINLLPIGVVAAHAVLYRPKMFGGNVKINCCCYSGEAAAWPTINKSIVRPLVNYDQVMTKLMGQIADTSNSGDLVRVCIVAMVKTKANNGV